MWGLNMQKQLTAFIVVASLASASAHAATDRPIRSRLQATVVADKFCGGDFGKSFAASPWQAHLNGSTWQMWKEDGEGGTLSVSINVLTGESPGCLYTPCGQTRIRTVCSDKFGHRRAH